MVRPVRRFPACVLCLVLILRMYAFDAFHGLAVFLCAALPALARKSVNKEGGESHKLSLPLLGVIPPRAEQPRCF